MCSRLGRAPLLAAALLLAGAAVLVPALSRNVEPAHDAAQHAKRAAEEAEAAVNALTKNDTWRDTIAHALTPRWFRHEPSCDTDPSACEEVSAESRSTLGRVRDSMSSLSHTLGFTHDEDEEEEEEEHPVGTAGNLLHRISSFFSGATDMAGDAANHVSGMSDELQKELGIKRKTLGDRIADALETLHIKSETPEKHAARVAAETLHGASNVLPDLSSIANMSPDVKGKWDALLKWAGIREPSTLEKAREEYDHALHRMKVALGAESPTLNERVNNRIADARDAVSNVYYTLRDSVLGPHDEPEEGILSQTQHGVAGAAGAVSDTFKHAWDASVGRAADAMLTARDSASSATDEALRTLHLKPARRTRLQAARDSLDAATHRMLVALGFQEPTAAERITRYTAALANRAQGVGRGTINAVGNAGAGVASVVGAGGNVLGKAPSGMAAALDTVLKALHLRERSKLEKAQETWHDAMHQLKVAMKVEDPTAAEQLGITIDNAQARLKNLAADVAAALPSGSGDAGISKSARKAYSKTLSRAGKTYASIRKDVDSALKAAGIKDRTLAEQITGSAASAWHDLGLALGMAEPTLGEKLHDALPLATQKRRTDSVWTKVLKATHIKPKTAQETARDAYFDGLRKLQSTLHVSQTADPTVLGRIENAITSSRDAVTAAVDAAGDATSNTAASAAQSLLSLRRELGRLLKLKGGTDKECSALQAARDTVDESIDSLWAALGYHEPSAMDRIKAGLVNALHGVGAHAAAQKAEAAIDPEGRLHGGPGVLNRMHMG